MTPNIPLDHATVEISAREFFGKEPIDLEANRVLDVFDRFNSVIKNVSDEVAECLLVIENPQYREGGAKWTEEEEKKLMPSFTALREISDDKKEIEILQDEMKENLKESSFILRSFDNYIKLLQERIKEVDDLIENFNVALVEVQDTQINEESSWAQQAVKKQESLATQKELLGSLLERTIQERAEAVVDLKSVKNVAAEKIDKILVEVEIVHVKVEPTVDYINAKMKKLGDMVRVAKDSLKSIVNEASISFKNIFSKCKSLFSNIDNLLENTKEVVNEANECLASRPKIQTTSRMNL
jgi:hypothetical protein